VQSSIWKHLHKTCKGRGRSRATRARRGASCEDKHAATSCSWSSSAQASSSPEGRSQPPPEPAQPPESSRPQVAAPAPLPPPHPAGEEKAAGCSHLQLRPRGRSRRRPSVCFASAPPACSASSGGFTSHDNSPPPHQEDLRHRRSSRSPSLQGDGGGCRRPGSAPTSSFAWARVRRRWWPRNPRRMNPAQGGGDGGRAEETM
jgi:hypothetical protein